MTRPLSIALLILFARLDVTAQPAPLRVVHYDAYLEPNPATGTIAGRVTLTVAPARDTTETLTLDRGDLEVESVDEEGFARQFEQRGKTLMVTLPPRSGVERRALTIRYHGAPKSGLLFFPERQQMYTLFSTSQWLVAVDAPDARATLHLEVVVPRGWRVVANGVEVGRRALSDTADLSEWRQTRAVPTYTFGFAAGRFFVVTEAFRGITLRYLADGFTPAQLRGVFGETSRMLDFFEKRSGVVYAHDRYSQVLVARTAGQEMAGFALMSEDYGRAVIADPAAVSLLAHEIAHQWWGNMVTCASWNHFWLNEGFATFMAAAYREERFGRDVYLKDVAAMRERYERVRANGHDRSLVFADWSKPSADDRTLVYQKGGYVLHLLRERLGDEIFWAGIRRYTTANFGQSVTSADFQRAMEQSSGQNLSDFFAQWVM